MNTHSKFWHMIRTMSYNHVERKYFFDLSRFWVIAGSSYFLTFTWVSQTWCLLIIPLLSILKNIFHLGGMWQNFTHLFPAIFPRTRAILHQLHGILPVFYKEGNKLKWDNSCLDLGTLHNGQGLVYVIQWWIQ